ncbi:MAG: hypothetical protein JWO95_980 [Verrucomicrobiales bacterium]|nr:hypothetical protein [Verrucomicrobiales bacterium]
MALLLLILSFDRLLLTDCDRRGAHLWGLDEEFWSEYSMNFQARLTAVFAAFIAVGIYVNLFSESARKDVQPRLYSATTNEVIAALGRPFRMVDGTNFTESADQMEEEGNPVSSGDMRAKGRVWLYPQGRATGTGMRRYQTIFFDERNRVYGVFTTFWINDIWQEK